MRQLLNDGSVEIVLSDLAEIDGKGLQALATLRWGSQGSRSNVHFTRLPGADHDADAEDPVPAVHLVTHNGVDVSDRR